MSPENRAKLEKYRPIYNMWIKDKVLLNTSFANEIEEIIRKELNPGYTAQKWCGKCCADMLELAFRHLDSLPKQVENENNSPNSGNRDKRHHRR